MRNLLLSTVFAALSFSAAPAAVTGYRNADKIALPDGGWDLVSFDPNLSRIYIAHGDKVTAVDAASGKVTGKFAPAAHAHAAIAVNEGSEVLVTNGGENTATFIDAATGALVATLRTGEKPDAALRDSATGLAVVMNAKSGTLTLVDPKAHAVVAEIAVGGSLELGVALGSGRIAVNVEDRNEVAIIDLNAREVSRRIPLAGCEGPTGITFLPVAKRLLSACANGVAAVSDPETGRLVTTLPIGQGPDSAFYDARRKLAFIPAGKSGELDVFSDEASAVRLIGAVPTKSGARTGALDEETGRVYLVAADYDAPAAAGARPQVKPGSVVLLVIAP